MGKRLVLAMSVVAVLVGLTTTPQSPARAAEPVTFEHVFSDGDAQNKSLYEIPDESDPCFGNDFVFRQGAYVLLVSASVALAGQTAVAPEVDGKRMTWNLIRSQPYMWQPDVGPARSAMFAVYQAWADDPDPDPTNLISFDFLGNMQDMHTRTFIQTTPGSEVERSNPTLQVVEASGTGMIAQASLNGFDDPISDAAVLALVKHSNPKPITWSGVTEIANTTPGSGDCMEGVQQHRVAAGVATGEVLNPSASWEEPEPADWQGVALEINAEGPPTVTTTTTTTMDPGPSTTTTTIPGQTPTTTVVGAHPDDLFVDDDGSVFEADIEAIARAGITLGCNPPVNDMFCPDDTLTRGQMAAFMARALGLTGDPDDRFTDDDDSVFETEIELIAQADITLGCNPPVNDRFCPDDTLTRGQMAAFMARALGLTGDPDDRFIDDDDSVFETEIEAIARAGITLGCNPPVNDMFCPDDTLTRGQMAAFLNRMLPLIPTG